MNKYVQYNESSYARIDNADRYGVGVEKNPGEVDYDTAEFGMLGPGQCIYYYWFRWHNSHTSGGHRGHTLEAEMIRKPYEAEIHQAIIDAMMNFVAKFYLSDKKFITSRGLIASVFREKKLGEGA